MKVVRTKDAVGHVICHDITRIVKDEIKGVAFRKGHIVQKEDIEVLLSIGKEHLYVWENQDGLLHENDAAEVLAAACLNEFMSRSEVKEGKIEILSLIDGLFAVDLNRLSQINSLEFMMVATRSSFQPVKRGDRLAGTRIIPLVIEKDKMDVVAGIADVHNPILKVLPFVRKRFGVVTTGSEVFTGRIDDTFTPVIEKKLEQYEAEVVIHKIVGDEISDILDAILAMKGEGVDGIICTGGMSVDPDDLTPAAIKLSGVNIVTYGAPILPGAMFLMGYFDDGTPVMGLPGCVMYAEATVFDIVLPRVLADVSLCKKDFVALGNGGLCLKCDFCHFPNCGYGKGVNHESNF